MAAVEVDRREIDRRVDGACPRPSTPRVLEVLGALVAFSGLVAAPLASARYLGVESLLVVGPLAAALLVVAWTLWTDDGTEKFAAAYRRVQAEGVVQVA